MNMMRKTQRTGSFFLVYWLNVALNFRLTIPGWILLVLSFIIPQYIRWWYCLAYFGAFLLYILIWMLIVRALARWVGTAQPAPPIENKNPYSVTGYGESTGWILESDRPNLNPYSVQQNPSARPAGTNEQAPPQ